MESGSYSERLKELMNLIGKNAPRAQIIAEAKALKTDMIASSNEIRRVVNLLDLMVGEYAPDPEWVEGLSWRESAKHESPTSSSAAPTVVRKGARASSASGPEHVLAIANKMSVGGIVATKDVTQQLRAEGDQRSDKALAIGVGNSLAWHGWQKIATGKYKKKEEGSR